MNRQNNTNLNNITNILCDFANKNLDCVDKIFEENRMIQNNIINDEIVHNENILSLLTNISNRNFILAERVLDQNRNIHELLTNLYSVNTNTQRNNNNNINPTNLINPTNPTNLINPTNPTNLRQASSYISAWTLGEPDSQQNNNNNISRISRMLFDSLPGLETRDISFNIQYMYDIDTSGNGLGFVNHIAFDNSGNRFFNNLEPVYIIPNESQIEHAVIRNIHYINISNPMNQSCPISTEPFHDNSNVSIIRHCRHIFNSDELSSWFRYNCICPVCRYDIRTF
jgi:hypothetical protein